MGEGGGFEEEQPTRCTDSTPAPPSPLPFTY